MAKNYHDIDRIIQSCLKAIENDGESLDSVIARYPDVEESIRPPLEAALWLKRVKHNLDPTPEFVSASRNRLVAQIQHGNVSAPPSKGFSLLEYLANLGRPQFAVQFAIALLLLVFFVVGTGSVVFAARNTIPGDNLYNVKLLQEQVRLAISFTDIGDARLHALFAQERLVEIQRLVLAERFEYLDQTVARYEHEIARTIELTRQVAAQDGAQALALASQMDETLSNQEMVLSTLSDQVPAQVEHDILMALDRTEEGLLELSLIRKELIGTEAPTATPTPTATIEPPTPTPSPSATDVLVPDVGLTPSGTIAPAVFETSSPLASPAPTQVSRPVQPATETPTKTPKPTEEKVKPKPTNTHRPTSRPTNPNRPTQKP